MLAQREADAATTLRRRLDRMERARISWQDAQAGVPACEVLILHAAGADEREVWRVFPELHQAQARYIIGFDLPAGLAPWLFNVPGYSSLITPRCCVFVPAAQARSRVDVSRYVGVGFRIKREYGDSTVKYAVPQPVADLLGLRRRVSTRGRDDVTTGAIIDHVAARAQSLWPAALVQTNVRLAQGAVDVAIVTPDMTIGVLVNGSDKTHQFRTHIVRGKGTTPFDYTIAIEAWPHTNDQTRYADHIFTFDAYTRGDGLAFFSRRFGDPNHVGDPRGLLLNRERAGHGADVSRSNLITALQRRERDTLTAARLREALLKHLSAKTERPSAIICELPVSTGRSAVADVAWATTTGLHLFEIKGESDTNARLARQVAAYDDAGSTCTLVVTENHRAFADRVPAHWGVFEAFHGPAEVELRIIREATSNPNQTALGAAQLLLSYGLKSALGAIGMQRVPRYVYQMREAAAKLIGLPALAILAARSIALRTNANLRKSTVMLYGEAKDWPRVPAVLRDAGLTNTLPLAAAIERGNGARRRHIGTTGVAVVEEQQCLFPIAR